MFLRYMLKSHSKDGGVQMSVQSVSYTHLDVYKRQTVKRIMNEAGGDQESAPHARQIIYVGLDKEARSYDLLRRAE